MRIVYFIMPFGLAGNIRAVASSSVRPSGFGDLNILDELGLNRQEAVFKSRTLALTNPKKYAEDRETEFNEMKTAVARSYKDTKASLANSGLGMIDVQRLAIDAANNTYATLNAVLETQFPSGSTELNIQTTAKDKFPGMVGAPTAPAAAPRRRAAPAKPRAPRKSRAKPKA